MSTMDTWIKSSYSGGDPEGNCVEVAFSGEAVAVRDSKNPAEGTLVLPPGSWRGFLGCIR
ncbi:DUF397 domain-containing protein [Amycolatopsis nigrescens]|uniref:DUF397 domain-containing protein n=1 Tax=Amycolatopsis nigrescens TaxID=381445 RepID=UPI00039FAD4D|nr:DUF397 domain-containing protein [Amycolatopsis nigrescens]